MKRDPSEISRGTKASLTISDLNHNGEGVGRLDGMVVFVPGALPDETVEVELLSLHKNFIRSKLLSIIKASAERTEPPCSYFADCGGCQLQHLNYPGQLQWKESTVRNALNRIGKIDHPVLPIRGMENPFRYRNKARVHLSIEHNHLKAGFYQKHSHRIIDIKECLIQHPNNVLAINALRTVLSELIHHNGKIGPDNFGFFEAEVRASFHSGQILMTISTDKEPGDKNRQFISGLFKEILGDKLAGLVLNITAKKINSYQTLNGNSYVKEKINPFYYRISPRSFFQVNPLQARELFEIAAGFAGNPDTAYDLYCGTGNFSLYLSRVAREVIGIDSEESAIRDARINATINGVTNVKFVKSRLEEASGILTQGKKKLTVIIDPPRKGCSPSLIESMEKIKPERIVYVSCNPATLARDLALLQQKGFSVREVQPVDMFPQTTHVETVVWLEK